MKHIILSRTDSIGDVLLTLPMAGILKHYFPDSKISFIGSSYTSAVVNCSKHIDDFIDWTQLQKLERQKQVKFFQVHNVEKVHPSQNQS